MLPSLLLLERIRQCLCLFVKLAEDAKSWKKMSKSLSLGHVPRLPSLAGKQEKLAPAASKVGVVLCSQQDSYGAKDFESHTKDRQTPATASPLQSSSGQLLKVPFIGLMHPESSSLLLELG